MLEAHDVPSTHHAHNYIQHVTKKHYQIFQYKIIINSIKYSIFYIEFTDK